MGCIMKFGIIGLPQTGKHTFFQLLTGAEPARHELKPGEAVKGIAHVRDPRFDVLCKMYEPHKQKPAEIEFNLFPALRIDQQGQNQWLAKIREMDAICYIVRSFQDPAIFHAAASVDPLRDVQSFALELLITDLDLAEKRADKLERELKRTRDSQQAKELETLRRCIAVLEEEKPLSTIEFSPEEAKRISGFRFLSLKPLLIVINGDEQGEPSGLTEAVSHPGQVETVFLNALEELEISQLESEEERHEFLETLGLTEPAIDRLSRQAFHLLGLVSFFTVGKDEVRAWPIRKGTLAPQAAGEIHSDIERGFIRAEVVAYDHLIEAGSEQKAKEAGFTSLKGKDYTVADGDVIHFRFSV